MTAAFIPKAFICASTGQCMKEPSIALCGHLFDAAHTSAGIDCCPIDGSKITKLIPCQELKAEIVNYQKHKLAVANGKAEAEDSEPSGSSSSRSFLDVASRSSQRPPEQATHPNPKFFKRIPGKRLTGSLKNSFQKGYIAKITNAHEDDVHGIVAIDSHRFVSGSKDNDLKIWTDHGHLERTFSNQLYKTYKTWITALCVLKDGTIVSGSRNGNITFWDQEGNIQREKRYCPPLGHVCKQRNMNRIHCVNEFPFTENPMFFTGTACYMQLWNHEGKLVLNAKAHDNDWVYSVLPLDESRIVLAIGDDLELWTKQQNGQHSKETLVEHKYQHGKQKHQRPLISSILSIQDQVNNLAITCFDGTVRLIDVKKQHETQRLNGHAAGKRVWNVVNVAPNMIASSGEDATIRLWDIRSNKEVLNIGNFPDRVSCLTKLGDTMLVAGSCPKDPYTSAQKAEITLWDYRYVHMS